eukprot:353618-Chlamydomonas_euryale.AAC.13
MCHESADNTRRRIAPHILLLKLDPTPRRSAQRTAEAVVGQGKRAWRYGWIFWTRRRGGGFSGQTATCVTSPRLGSHDI